MAVQILRNFQKPSNFLLLIRNKQILISNKSIMTSKQRLGKVLEELEKNPYFDKYANKIARLQETSPEEFLKRVEEKEKKLQEEKEKRARERSFQQTAAKPNLQPGVQTQETQLNKIMKVDLVKDKSKDEIIEIWKEYHKDKDFICGMMTSEQFEKMFDRGKQYNTFLLPLPRENGYEFIVIQFFGTEIHMTPLLWYQTHKENAPECLTMTHFTEFKDSKDLVLMRGEFDTKSINVQEAQCLANELQLYYAMDNPERLRLLDIFTKKPDEFKHMDLVAQMDSISLQTDCKK